MCRATTALLLVIGSLATLAECKQPSLFSLQIYNANSYLGHPWWEMLDSEVPQVQNQAALFDAGLQSGNFGGMFVQLVAQGKRADAARALAYLINANLTLSGGCPVPPPAGTVFAQELSMGIADAVEVPADQGNVALDLPGNVTQADVADAIVAGAMLAAKSCGPPNALSYRSQKQEVASYLNSTCYYVGPLLGPPLGAPDGVLNASLGAASDLCNLQDPWGAGAVLTAMQECLAGGEDLEQPPPWLPHTFGPIDDNERAESISAQAPAAFAPARVAPAPAPQGRPSPPDSTNGVHHWAGAPNQDHGGWQQTLGGRRRLA